MQKTNPRYDVHVHNFRNRLCDIDGISVKFALDAIVRDARTIFEDDSAVFIRSISYSQEKAAQEKTVITFQQVIE